MLIHSWNPIKLFFFPKNPTYHLRFSYLTGKVKFLLLASDTDSTIFAQNTIQILRFQTIKFSKYSQISIFAWEDNPNISHRFFQISIANTSIVGTINIACYNIFDLQIKK